MRTIAKVPASKSHIIDYLSTPTLPHHTHTHTHTGVQKSASEFEIPQFFAFFWVSAASVHFLDPKYVTVKE